MKFLDCFCGLGGASEGFHREGFECLGIEINPKIAKLYPYDVIVADIRTLNGENFKGFDVIWGSPPCKDFSTANCPNKTREGRKAPDANKKTQEWKKIKGSYAHSTFQAFAKACKEALERGKI